MGLGRCIRDEARMGIIEKIKEIEAEMARTQKNKATGLILILIQNFLNYLVRASLWIFFFFFWLFLIGKNRENYNYLMFCSDERWKSYE